MRGPRVARPLAALALSAVLAAPALAQQAPAPAKPPARQAPAAPKPVIEQRAVDVVKAAAARLAAARSMSFTALVTYEYPSLYGPPIAYTTRSAVAMQRPDKLLVVTPGDGPASELYYDGKRLMAYSPGEDLVAVADAPPTIEAALRFLFDATATYFPFTDLLLPDPYAALSDGMKLAFYIGRADTVGGTTTDLVAIASDDVFLQLWIGVEDRLPRRIRATYARDPLQLRHQLDLADWQLDVPQPPEKFASAKAAAGKPITFGAPAYRVPPPGVKPPPKPKATKAQ
jgi:hypothetical protein